MSHIGLDELEEYSRNKVAPEQLAHIEEHLLICEQCRTVLDGLDAEARTMRHALVHFLKPPDA